MHEKEKIIQYSVVVLPKLPYERITPYLAVKHIVLEVIKAEAKRIA